MDKETVKEIADQLGLASKDVMILLSQYQYISGIINIITLLLCVILIASVVIITINHYKTTDKTDDDAGYHIIFAVSLTVVISFFCLSIMKNVIKVVAPKACAANNLVKALRGR